jgi:hypothetical protein
VRFATGLFSGRLHAAAAVLGLLLARLALKAPPPLFGTGVDVLLLAVLVGWGLRRILRATDADRTRLVLATDS